MKTLKSFLIVVLSLCVAALFGIFAVACGENKDPDDQKQEQPDENPDQGGNQGDNQGGNQGGNQGDNQGGNQGGPIQGGPIQGGPGGDEDRGGPGTSTGEGYLCTNPDWEVGAGELDATYTYTYTIVTGEGSSNEVTATVVLSPDGTVTVTAAKAGVKMGASEMGYEGNYGVHNEAPPPVSYAVITGLALIADYDGEMGAKTGDAPSAGFIDWSDSDGNAILKLNEDGTCAPVAEDEISKPDGEGPQGPEGGPGAGGPGTSTGEGYVCTNAEWEAAASAGELDATYTYTYSITSGEGSKNDVTATVVLSDDGTVTVTAAKPGFGGASEMGYEGVYSVYADGSDTYVIITGLGLTADYEGQMGAKTGDAPSAGFINWSDSDGNAILLLNADNTCAPVEA